MEFLDRLSPRERLLIYFAGALIGILVVLMLVIRPLVGYRAEARAEFDRAAETYRLVGRAATQGDPGQALDASALRSLLARTASENGIVINRISSREGQVDLFLAETTSAALFGWIALLEEQHQVYVVEASIRPSSSGTSLLAQLSVASGA